MNKTISQTSAPRSLVGTASRIRSVGEGERIRGRGWTRTVLVSLAVLSGSLALAMVFGPFLGWSVVRLASGSMAPALPADSLLLVHRVRASEVSVGDIVMLGREGLLPVTHRVVSIARSPRAPQDRVFTIKGDANARVDVRSYTSDLPGLVVAGVPWGGQIVVALRSPVGLGLLTIIASAIVLWAWWPHRSSGRPRHLMGRP